MVVICLRYKCLKPKRHFENSRKLAKKLAYHDQRSIRCWVKSKLQSALILRCFLEFSPKLPLNQLNKSSAQRKLKKNTQVTSKITSSTHDVKQQLQFVYFSHLLIFKDIKLIVFSSQVISTCELVNQKIIKVICSSETNDVNQSVLQMCLKIAPVNFFFSPYLTQRFLSVFDIFKMLFPNSNSHTSASY